MLHIFRSAVTKTVVLKEPSPVHHMQNSNGGNQNGGSSKTPSPKISVQEDEEEGRTKPSESFGDVLRQQQKEMRLSEEEEEEGGGGGGNGDEEALVEKVNWISCICTTGMYDIGMTHTVH